MADNVLVQCPHCKRELVEGRDYIGRLATCPFCQKAIPPPVPSAVPTPVGTPLGFDYPVAELSGVEIAPEVLALVSEQFAREKRILPLTLDDDVLTVVMTSPPAPEVVDNLRFLLNRPIAVAVAPRETLAAAIQRFYPEADAKTEEPAPARRRWVDIESPTIAFENMLPPDNAAVSRMVQTILREAFQLGASRVLILPFKNRVKVAYRIEDGIHTREDLPPEMLYSILCTLMTMTDLSGCIKVIVAKQERQVRLTFQSTEYGVSALIDIAQGTSASQLSQLRASKLGYPFVEIGEIEIPRSVLNLVPENVARKNCIIPLEFDGEKVTLAMGSPRDPEILDRLRFALNRPIVVVLAAEGAIVAAIERYYGASDPETADLVRKHLELAPEAAEAHSAAEAPVANHPATQPFLDFLRTIYREPMLQLFEEIRASRVLCQTDPATGSLAVVFSHADLMGHMPVEAQTYIHNKIWTFRESLASRLEMFLDHDPLARGLAQTYALYVACCRLAQGQPTSVNPSCLHEAWLNCLYALLTRWFPSLNTNGTVTRFLAEHADQLSAKVAALLANPALVVEPASVRPWFARLERQMITDEPIDCHSPWIVHLLDLLLAEATRGRASHLLLLPWDDRVEVAYRVQKTVYGRQSLPLGLLLPLVARLRLLASQDDILEIPVDKKPRHARVRFQCLPTGMSAQIDLLPDRASIVACENQAMLSGLRMVDLSELEIPPRLLAVVPKSAVWKKRILPLAIEGNQITVAMSTAPSPQQAAELKVLFRRPVSVVLAPEDALIGAIYRHFHPAAAAPAPSGVAVALLEQAVRELAQTTSNPPAGQIP